MTTETATCSTRMMTEMASLTVTMRFQTMVQSGMTPTVTVPATMPMMMMMEISSPTPSRKIVTATLSMLPRSQETLMEMISATKWILMTRTGRIISILMRTTGPLDSD